MNDSVRTYNRFVISLFEKKVFLFWKTFVLLCLCKLLIINSCVLKIRKLFYC